MSLRARDDVGAPASPFARLLTHSPGKPLVHVPRSQTIGGQTHELATSVHPPSIEDLWNIGTIVYNGCKQAQALRMAKEAEADEPIGTASIASCLALSLALLSDLDVRAKLLSFLGLENLKQLLSLEDPTRLLSVMLSTKASDALKESPMGPVCQELWNKLGASKIDLNGDPPLETQLNEMLKDAWQTKEDVFKPFQIVKKADVQYLIAALVSMEKIEVSWTEELDHYQDRKFTTVSGVAVMAPFCVDETAREMSSLSFKGGKAVLLPCTPKQNKTRGMIFVLPEEKDMKLNECLEALSKHADRVDGQGRRQGLVFRKYPKYFQILFYF